MKTSITSRTKKIIYTAAAIAFWILVWEALALKIGSDLILASPVQVLKELWAMLFDLSVWRSVAFSFVRISLGFVCALVLGSLAAVVSSRVQAVKILLAPITSFIKSTPVASFIILAIIWFGSRNLSVFISFLMVFPIIYLNLLGGIESASVQLKEMADVYGLSVAKKLIYVYLPQLMPFVISACSVALGLCWKSGVAAEVIGISTGSIGERLYRAKLYFETGKLLAWTIVIILISVLFEKLVLFALRRMSKIPAAGFSRASLIKAGKLTLGAAKANAKTAYISQPDGCAPEVALDGVSKSFDGAAVLDGLSLKISGGEHVAVMGRSGAGKTTLSRIIMGFEKPDCGSVSIDASAGFGVVFQEDRLIDSLNAIANIAIAGGGVQEAYNLMREFGFTDELTFKPCLELSGGERRRVAIARALLCGGGIMIFDEPFKGIDDKTLFNSIMPMVKTLSAGKTFILITHSAEEAESLCQRTVNID